MFLSHYRMLGVVRFKYIDNGSTDGSAEYLQAQPDVDWLYQKETYGPDNLWGSHWQTAEIRRSCPDAWVLALDTDELLHLPLDIGIGEMADIMDAEGADLMKANIIDLYPRGRLRGASMADCVWYDRPYSKPELKQLRLSSGQRLGRLRHRVFGMWNAYYAKSPLFRMNATVEPSGGFHNLTGRFTRSRHIGMIAHCKFTDGFKAYVDDSVTRGVHWNESQEYRQYQTRYVDHLWSPDFSEPLDGDLHRQGLLSNEGYVAGEGGYVLGDHFHYGRDGVPKNERVAFELWREDAEMGLEDGRARLAWAYRTGRGCARNLEQAEQWSRGPDGSYDRLAWGPWP